MQKSGVGDRMRKIAEITLLFLLFLADSKLLGHSLVHQVQNFWVQVDQEFLSCTLEELNNGCRIEGKGWGSFDPVTGIARWQASTHQRVGGLGIEGFIGTAKRNEWHDFLSPMAHDHPQWHRSLKVISNGFQSWSLSGMIDIPGPKSLQQLSSLLDRKNEEFRDGTEHSWEFGLLLNQSQYSFIGALSATTWRPWVRFWHDQGAQQNYRVGFFAISGMSGDQVAISEGSTIRSEPWFFLDGSTKNLPEDLRKYQKTLDHNRTKKHDFVAHPAGRIHFGWNSWYHLWNGVTQKDVDQNLDIVSELFPRLLQGQADRYPLTATVDDGWQQRWGDWHPNRKFPNTLIEMAQSIRSKGFIPGLWLAPFLVSITSPLIEKNPHWFVKTPDFDHPSGRYKILDTSHPEVLRHLRDLMIEVKAAGFGFVKLDFMFTGTFVGGRYGEVTSMQAYEMGLALIRETLGPQVEILACGAPQLASRPYVDRWRIGPDIAYQFPSGNPTWVDLDIQLRNLGARWFLCNGLACDSDPWLMRGRRPLKEVTTALWVASLMGNGFTLSDNFQLVSKARQHFTPQTEALVQATSGTPSTPDYGQWMLDSGERLEAVRFIDRLYDRKSFQSPRLWNTAHLGQVLLNFSEKPFRWGTYMAQPRQSLYRQGFTSKN